MKRKIFILVSLGWLLLGNVARAEDVMEIERHFNLDDFKIEYNGNKIKVLTDDKLWEGWYQTLEPYMPQMSYQEVLPKNVYVTDLLTSSLRHPTSSLN